MSMISTLNDRNLDIVFCIDTTGNNFLFLETLQHEFKGFYEKLGSLMKDQFDYRLVRLNVKAVAFKDYLFDDNPMIISDWFSISEDGEEDFLNFLAQQEYGGGGDLPENGLEALFYGMTADWTVGENRGDRQIIVLFTDADAHPLGSYVGCPGYPDNMVDEEGLIRTWMGDPPAYAMQGNVKLNQRNKRLIIFALEGTVYDQLSEKLDRVMFYRKWGEHELWELIMDEILGSISIAACIH